MMASITINSDSFGKRVKVRIWQGDEPEKQEVYQVDDKQQAIKVIRNRERQLGRRITIECCV